MLKIITKFINWSMRESLRSVVLSSFLVFTLFSYSLLVQNIAADRLFTLQDQATANPQKKLPAQDNQDTSDAEDSTDTIDQIKPTLKRITSHNAASDPRFCVGYDQLTRSITVSCKTANLSHVDNVLKNPAVLKKEGDGVWLLNANLTIADGSDFNVNSTDTKWLKINSTTSADAYHIDVIGNMKVDSVKISSWNTTSNNYTATDGKIHRASLAVLPEASGKTNITNSEISHLGYGTSLRQGLSYYGGDGSVLRNNTIHHLWYGFYSKGIGNMTIEDNNIYANVKYGVDPHTGTHDMIIRNNRVHENEGLGIVCSFDCTNIIMEGNEVHGNKLAGIMLSRNVMDSAVRNNTIYNEAKGIVISESHQDNIYNNTVSDSDIGIEAKFGSSKNNIHNNSILQAAKYGIQMTKGATENTVMHNNVIDSTKYGICVYNNGTGNMIIENSIVRAGGHAICVYDKSSGNEIKSNSINGAAGYGIYVTDSDVNNNTFMGNQIRMAKVGISVSNNTGSVFTQNNIGVVKDSEYFISGNSTVRLANTSFSSDQIRAADGGQNSISISDSGKVDIRNKAGNKTTFDTNKSIYSAVLPDRESITIRTVE
ncbi:MAG: right-handed parallel beta-helix repeat-containing protein [Nitrososphaeraceae archaeon]